MALLLIIHPGEKLVSRAGPARGVGPRVAYGNECVYVHITVYTTTIYIYTYLHIYELIPSLSLCAPINLI